MPRNDLTARAAAVRAEAKAARSDVSAARQRELELEVTFRRELRAREAAQAAAKAASKDADDASTVAGNTEPTEEFDRHIADVGRRDAREAEELREIRTDLSRMSEAQRAVQRQSELEAARFTETAAEHNRRVTEAHLDLRETQRRGTAAESQLDKFEDQARLLDEAARRFAAAQATDDIVRRAELELAAEATLQQADRIDVDRGAIRVLVPGFPERTPGVDGVSALSAPEADAPAPSHDDLVVAGSATAVDATGEAGAGEAWAGDVAGGSSDETTNDGLDPDREVGAGVAPADADDSDSAWPVADGEPELASSPYAPFTDQPTDAFADPFADAAGDAEPGPEADAGAQADSYAFADDVGEAAYDDAGSGSDGYVDNAGLV